MLYNNMFCATVLEVLPDYGMAIIDESPMGGPALATMPCSDTIGGVYAGGAIVSGTRVLCSRMWDSSPHVMAIVGPVNVKTDRMTMNYKQSLDYNLDKFTQAMKGNVAADDLAKFLAKSKYNWCRNRAHGVPGDALPGDYDIRDKAGGARIHVGRSVALLGSGPLAFVDASSVTHRLRMFGERLQSRTIQTEDAAEPGYRVRNTAVSVSEAFGLPFGDPVVKIDAEDDYALSSIAPDALPFYRLQAVEGAVAYGSEASVLDFPKDRDGGRAPQHDAEEDHEPCALSRRRQSLSGELSDASAYGMASVKTPFVPVVLQTGYGKAPWTEGLQDGSGSRFDDLREPYEPPQKERELVPKAPEDTPEDRKVLDAALNKLVGRLLDGDYRDALLKAMAAHGFSVSTRKGSLEKMFDEDDLTRQPGGATDAGMYALPKSIRLTDPATGEVRDYYATTSFITQEPDGSICICDGYGSEIRMCRGNIYISPALDLQLRPGRDISVMAGRHQSYNAQGTCTINCSDSMYIRAAANLRVVAATSDRKPGSLTLECRNGVEDGGSVTVTAATDLSVTGQGFVHVGRKGRSEKASRGVLTEPDRAGAVIIDAAETGGLYLKGAACTIDGRQTVVGAFSESGEGGAALVVDQTTISTLAQNVVMPARVLVNRLKERPSVPLYRNGKETRAVLSPSGQGVLTVEGDVVMHKNLVVHGTGKFDGQDGKSVGVFAYSVAASAVNDSVDPKKGNPFYMKDLDATGAPDEYGRGVALSVDGALNTVYQDWWTNDKMFRFPASYGVADGLMPGMVWQSRDGGYTGQGGAGTTTGVYWNESAVVGPDGVSGMCYPGLDARTNGLKITLSGYREDKLSTGYRINVTEADKEVQNG